MLEVLSDIANFFFGILTDIFDLYTTSKLFAGFFTLWLADRMFGIFDVIKHR